MFKVLKGNQKEKPDYFKIHYRGFENAAGRFIATDNRGDLYKAVYHGVYLVAHGFEERPKAPDWNFTLVELVRTFLAKLTPHEVMRLFPVTKEYGSEKRGWKGYQSTMNALKDYDMDAPIGEKVDRLLWVYRNYTMEEFWVNMLGVVSDLRRSQGEPGLMEQLCKDNNLTTYTMTTDPKTGKQYVMNDATGRTARARKQLPRYMKVIKGGNGE